MALHQFECDFRCHIPAIVVANQDGNAFNPQKMTISVQPAIKEVIRQGAVPTITTLPILDDVPIKIPTGGGWSLTLPIKIGDECELSFQDMAFDNWWQSGGIQKQPDGVLFRHDIGDAFAEFGVRSVPNVIPNYSIISAQLRNDAGTVMIDLVDAGITITAPIIKAINTGGTAQTLMTDTFFQWFKTNIEPFLVSKGYIGPAIPATGCETIILEGQ
jgi:hypothetical protein